ncbi:MAG TPA: helix-turn-helix transcriptional regulator [Dokdonella sp.]|jgi:transcriptional regulator with XRE-family HTH domain|uniref:helix-turn-helix domain-containing protein n=1 Tax=Dokdonella sp. TaxID=2291710 RepID=UPI002B71BE26|nr:helix-turn-helix transcriptional regulator [Dokdonella sp.]HNV08673.1 helix-turn-helix transcriptional regulator [Dokdonella sp.]HPW04159.1 helix-turn-helix transcriptional regulator [Dokdonella sp.]
MAEDPRILFGRRLAQMRRARGWSQETLSLESGVARSYLGGVERGQRNIALLNICRLAETLEVPVADLFAHPNADEPGNHHNA